MKILITISRWILILPVSVATFYYGDKLFNAIWSILTNEHGAKPPAIWIAFVSTLVSHALSILVGMYLAPKFRKSTGITLILLKLLLSSFFIYGLILANETLNLINIGVALAPVLGSIGGFYLYMEEEN